jgi:hypothetical protein
MDRDRAAAATTAGKAVAMIVVVMVLAIMMLIVLVMLISMLWSAVVVDRVIVVLSYRRSTKRFACSILRTQGALGGRVPMERRIPTSHPYCSPIDRKPAREFVTLQVRISFVSVGMCDTVLVSGRCFDR